MAIDPKLVSIKTAEELPVSDPSENANFLFYEGDKLQTSPMSNIYGRVISGIKGIATQANAPTAYTAEAYPDGLIETYRAVEPLNNTSAWYTLSDATNKAKFPITQEILNVNDVLLTSTNGVVSVFLNAKIKGLDGISATANIPDYSDIDFPLEYPSMFTKDDRLYQVLVGQSLLESDVVETSPKLKIIKGADVTQIIQYVADPDQVFEANYVYNDIFDI